MFDRRWDAFISYSSKDQWAANEVREALERTGVRCWIAPRDVAPGADWPTAIIEGLAASQVVVLLLSGNAINSAQVQREVTRASESDKAIATLRIDNVAPAGGLAFFLSGKQWIDGTRRPLQTSLNPLVDAVHGILRGAPAPPSQVKPTRRLREVQEFDLDDLSRKSWKVSRILKRGP